MHLRKVSGQRRRSLLDEPLSSDWDGNELLLSDILGTEPDSVIRPIEDDVDRNSCARLYPVCRSANGRSSACALA